MCLCSLTVPIVIPGVVLKRTIKIAHLTIGLHWSMASLMSSTAISLLGSFSYRVSAWHITAQ